MSDSITYPPVRYQPPAKPPNATLETLEAVQRIFDDYVAFPSDEARDAVVLWTLHTHVFRAFDSTPRLSIRSTEPGSGKSRVLELLESLTPNSLNAISLTPAVLWRLMDHGQPTILLDEVDTIFGRNGSSSAYLSLRAIINAGHRQGATVPPAPRTSRDSTSSVRWRWPDSAGYRTRSPPGRWRSSCDLAAPVTRPSSPTG
jgi:hypothetical protein